MKKIILALSVFLCLLAPSISLADSVNNTTPRTWDLSSGDYSLSINETGESTQIEGSQENFTDVGILGLISRIVNFFARIVGTLAILGIVYGGLKIILHAGNEEAVSAGKEALKYSILGLIFVFGAYLIIKFVEALVYSLA